MLESLTLGLVLLVLAVVLGFILAVQFDVVYELFGFVGEPLLFSAAVEVDHLHRLGARLGNFHDCAVELFFCGYVVVQEATVFAV